MLLDIPLARGEAAAVAGKLLIYGAGDEAAFEACRPAFGAFASDIFHLGAAGAGQVGKMVNNLILWACIVANDEGLPWARRSASTARACRPRCTMAARRTGRWTTAPSAPACRGPKRT